MLNEDEIAQKIKRIQEKKILRFFFCTKYKRNTLLCMSRALASNTQTVSSSFERILIFDVNMYWNMSKTKTKEKKKEEIMVTRKL